MSYNLGPYLLTKPTADKHPRRPICITWEEVFCCNQTHSLKVISQQGVLGVATVFETHSRLRHIDTRVLLLTLTPRLFAIRTSATRASRSPPKKHYKSQHARAEMGARDSPALRLSTESSHLDRGDGMPEALANKGPPVCIQTAEGSKQDSG